MNYLLGIITGICVGIAPTVFQWADVERGYDGTGGEIFIFLIPVLAWLMMGEIKEWREEKQDAAVKLGN